MAGRLSATRARSVKDPGRYHDGDGLMLDVKKSGSKSWVVRLQAEGKRRDFGLGSAKDIDLAEARELARQYRKQVRAGVDPTATRRARGGALAPTFEDAAVQYYNDLKRGWGNGKHVAQWIATLRTYAFPSIGKVRVDQVSTGQVRDLLNAIWREEPETARRVRQRVKCVMEFAHGKNWRAEPFAMDEVSRTLSKQPRSRGQFAAVPIADLPGFVGQL